MVLLSVATKKIHPSVGLTYRIGKLSYKFYSAQTILGKVDIVASYLLGLVNGRLALGWVCVKWLWKAKEKDVWAARVEEYINEFLPDGKKLSLETLMAAAMKHTSPTSKQDLYRKAAAVYLAECYQRHVCCAGELYRSDSLPSSPRSFPAKSCLKDFFSSPYKLQLVKLVKEKQGDLTQGDTWEREVQPLVTAMLKECDSRLMRDVIDLVVL